MGCVAVLPHVEPCQVPRARRPPVTEIESWTEVSAVRTCAGMSSSPSAVWMNSRSPSGTRRAKKASRSRRTPGSAFSWIRSEANVCRRSRVSRPSRKPCSEIHRSTSPGGSRQGLGLRVSTSIQKIAEVPGTVQTRCLHAKATRAPSFGPVQSFALPGRPRREHRSVVAVYNAALAILTRLMDREGRRELLAFVATMKIDHSQTLLLLGEKTERLDNLLSAWDLLQGEARRTGQAELHRDLERLE